MKSNFRFTKRNWLIVGAVAGLCLLGSGWLLWQQRQTQMAASSIPVYVEVQTRQGVAYKEIPAHEYKKRWKQMAASSTPIYLKIKTAQGDKYAKIPTPEGLKHSQKSLQYRIAHNWPAAVEEARQAVRADPKNRDFQWELGVTLQRAGQTAEAIAVLRELSQQKDAVGQSSAIESAAIMLRKIEQNPKWGQPKR